MSSSDRSPSLNQLSDTCPDQTDTLCWQLFDEIPIALFTIDLQLKLLSANRCFQLMTGHDPHDWLGQSVVTLFREAGYGRPEQFLRTRFEKSGPCFEQTPAEFEFLLADGKRIPVELRTNLVETPNDRIMLCAMMDITERKRSRKAFIESQNRLRDILDNTETCVYVKDLEGRYQFVNRRFEELFHLRMNDLLGKTDEEIFPKDLAENFRRNDRAVAELGETIQVKEIAPHEDGPHLYLSSKFPLKNQKGEIYATAGISTDITQMDHQSREVERLKTSLELILNSVSDGIIGGNRSGEIEFMNRAAREILKLQDAGENENTKLESIRLRAVPYETRTINLPELFHNLISTPEKTLHYPMAQLQFPDGQAVPADISCGIMENEEGLIESVVTLRDITHHEQLRLKSNELRTAQIVQRQLYPQVPPRVDGFQFAGRAMPASQACGDYYDFILSEERSEIVLTIGDVTGHGLGPALQMVETRAYLRAMLQQPLELDETISKLNDFLVEDTPEGSFISLLAAKINPASRTVKYVGAGHDAWIFRQSGEAQYLSSSGLLLGLISDSEYECSEEIPLHHGDLLVMITDGLHEAIGADNELYGVERMVDFIQAHRDHTPTELIDLLIEDLNEYIDHRPPLDDITIVVSKADFDS